MATALPENRLAEIADLEKWYPQFGAAYEVLRPGFRQCVLDSTSCLFDDCLEICRLLEAHVHATAHQLMRNLLATSGSGDGSKGKVLSQKMGPVSRTYEGSTVTGFEGDWATTIAGQAYLQILEEQGPVAITPGGRSCSDDDFDFIGGRCG
jgi:hypothetical protein